MQKSFTILLLALLCFFTAASQNQQCTNRFSSLIYKGISYDSFTCITTSRANEIVTGAMVYKDQSLLTKFSAKGTPLFSFQYYPVYELNLTFYLGIKYTQVTQTKDGGFALAANAWQIKWVNTGNGPNPAELGNNVGMLIKVDAFGNPVWCQRLESANSFRNSGFNLSVTNVIETTSGDLIAYLASDYGRNYPNYGRLVCFSANGDVKWNTLLAAGYDGGLSSLNAKRGLVQTKTGDIVLSDLVYQANRTTQPEITTAASIHFLSIDASNGAIKWETNYTYPFDNAPTLPEITSLAELANGNLVCTASFFPVPNETKKAIRIVTDNKGIFQSALTYQESGNSATQLLSATLTENGSQTYLFKTGVSSIVAKVAPDGNILWQQGFSNYNGLYPANCHTATNKGLGIFASDFNHQNIRLFLTDSTGAIDCVNEPALLNAESVRLQSGTKITTEPSAPDQNKFGTARFSMRADPYPFTKTVECEAAADCCSDVVDSTSHPLITQCEGIPFRLPDNTMVTTSGTYYVIFKTAKGCDSVVYFRIKFDKNVAALNLGQDQCLLGKDSLILHATGGYENYYWMNALTPSFDSSYTIKKPATYFVTVKNACGQKTDSITIYPECNFPVYMPSAFSPNSDGKNDVFRVPPSNKNNFVSLQIFNRWGQPVFFSTDVSKGWNGSIKNIPQETGVYVYHLKMADLSGKAITQSGTVLLIR